MVKSALEAVGGSEHGREKQGQDGKKQADLRERRKWQTDDTAPRDLQSGGTRKGEERRTLTRTSVALGVAAREKNLQSKTREKTA